MINRDRDLLVRMAQVNRSLGIVAAEAMARQDGGELPAQPLREIGQALRALADELIARADEIGSVPAGLPTPPTAMCALCHAEPVARPDQAADTVEGRFCADCIARCLDDTRRGHWCPIDTLAHTDHEVPTDV